RRQLVPAAGRRPGGNHPTDPAFDGPGPLSRPAPASPTAPCAGRTLTEAPVARGRKPEAAPATAGEAFLSAAWESKPPNTRRTATSSEDRQGGCFRGVGYWRRPVRPGPGVLRWFPRRPCRRAPARRARADRHGLSL